MACRPMPSPTAPNDISAIEAKGVAVERAAFEGPVVEDAEGAAQGHEAAPYAEVVAARAPHADGVPGLDDLDLARGEGQGADDGAIVAVRPALAFEDAVGGEPGGVVGAARERPAAPGEVAAIDGFGRPARLPGAGDEGLARTEDLRGRLGFKGAGEEPATGPDGHGPAEGAVEAGGGLEHLQGGRQRQLGRVDGARHPQPEQPRLDDALDDGRSRARLALRALRLVRDKRGHVVKGVEVGRRGVHGGSVQGYCFRSKTSIAGTNYCSILSVRGPGRGAWHRHLTARSSLQLRGSASHSRSTKDTYSAGRSTASSVAPGILDRSSRRTGAGETD